MVVCRTVDCVVVSGNVVVGFIDVAAEVIMNKMKVKIVAHVAIFLYVFLYDCSSCCVAIDILLETADICCQNTSYALNVAVVGC